MVGLYLLVHQGMTFVNVVHSINRETVPLLRYSNVICMVEYFHLPIVLNFPRSTQLLLGQILIVAPLVREQEKNKP